jgi:hypothetical protein
MTKKAKMRLAIPLVVPNARFTLLRSLCFTIACWYINSDANNRAPTQKNIPPLPRYPAVTTRQKVTK